MFWKGFILGASVAGAGFSLFWAIKKFKSSREDRCSPPNEKSDIKLINEDKIKNTSEEHIQAEQDFTLDTVTPKQSHNEKNSRAARDSESVKSLLHTSKLVSKEPGKNPVDDPSSTESEEQPVDPIDDLPVHIIALETIPIYETSFAAPVPTPQNANIEAETQENKYSADVPSTIALEEPISRPVMPVDPMDDLPAPTVISETIPVPETSVAAPEVSIPTLQNANVEPDVPEKNESHLPDDSPPECPLPGIEQQDKRSVTLIHPLEKNVSDQKMNNKDQLDQSRPVMPVEPIDGLPALTVIFETIPVPETSVAAPEISIQTPQNANIEPDVPEKNESNLPDDSPPECPLPGIEQQEKRSVRLIHPLEKNVLDQMMNNIDQRDQSRPVMPVDPMDGLQVPTVILETIPVLETSVAVQETSTPTPQNVNVEPDVPEKNESNLPDDSPHECPLPGIEQHEQISVISTNPFEKNASDQKMNNKDQRDQSRPVMPVDPMDGLLAPTVILETIPVPETSVAAPEASIPTPQNANVEPDVPEKHESYLPDDSPPECPLSGIEQYENPSVIPTRPFEKNVSDQMMNNKNQRDEEALVKTSPRKDLESLPEIKHNYPENRNNTYRDRGGKNSDNPRTGYMRAINRGRGQTFHLNRDRDSTYEEGKGRGCSHFKKDREISDFNRGRGLSNFKIGEEKYDFNRSRGWPNFNRGRGSSRISRGSEIKEDNRGSGRPYFNEGRGRGSRYEINEGSVSYAPSNTRVKGDPYNAEANYFADRGRRNGEFNRGRGSVYSRNVSRDSGLFVEDCKIEEPPEWMKSESTSYKYWNQRFKIFKKFDKGILLDREAWYSTTFEDTAKQIAERCRCDTVIDAFCGVGGITIQLALVCRRVIAIDIDPLKIEMARNNAAVYGVEDKIEFIVGDFFKLSSTLQADVVFIDPPWGGPEYLKQSLFDFRTMAVDIFMALKRAMKITKNIAILLPRNSDGRQIEQLASGRRYVIEENWLGSKLKTLTIYLGDLSKCHQNYFWKK